MFKKLLINLGLICVLISMLIGGMWLLDYIGLIDKEKTIYPILGKIPIVGKFFLPPYPVDIELLKEERLRKYEKLLKQREEELNERESLLAKKEKELEEKEAYLEGLEDELENMKKNFEERLKEEQEEEKKWETLAVLYQKMRPKVAALILQQMDDETVINILKRMQEDSVAITLMEMNPERAARLSRKMSK